jgi:RNA polymerase-binding protein DksA
MSVLDRLEEQLLDIDRALERIDEGTYGICTNCGKPIQAERLEALPWAELCIDCQRKRVLCLSISTKIKRQLYTVFPLKET